MRKSSVPPQIGQQCPAGWMGFMHSGVSQKCLSSSHNIDSYLSNRTRLWQPQNFGGRQKPLTNRTESELVNIRWPTEVNRKSVISTSFSLRFFCTTILSKTISSTICKSMENPESSMRIVSHSHGMRNICAFAALKSSSCVFQLLLENQFWMCSLLYSM